MGYRSRAKSPPPVKRHLGRIGIYLVVTIVLAFIGFAFSNLFFLVLALLFLVLAILWFMMARSAARRAEEDRRRAERYEKSQG
jgi:ABC-type transport system involved in cytochrome bd biosynthesis fused ATPase/permease subunit